MSGTRTFLFSYTPPLPLSPFFFLFCFNFQICRCFLPFCKGVLSQVSFKLIRAGKGLGKHEFTKVLSYLGNIYTKLIEDWWWRLAPKRDLGIQVFPFKMSFKEETSQPVSLLSSFRRDLILRKDSSIIKQQSFIHYTLECLNDQEIASDLNLSCLHLANRFHVTFKIQLHQYTGI